MKQLRLGQFQRLANLQELFTESLLRVVVEWKGVEALAKSMQEDKDYHAFVHNHLRKASKEDLDAIHSRAKMNCPKGHDTFCAEMASAARPFQTLAPIAPSGTPAAAPAPQK